MIYITLDARFVTPPPFIHIVLKTLSKAILVNEPKCYSDWHLGAIEIELTALTLGITEDSAKQLVNSLQLTVICMIRLTK